MTQPGSSRDPMAAVHRLPGGSTWMWTLPPELGFVIERGQGVWVYDVDGKKYLDGLAGIAVNTLGHKHPRLTAAVADQAGKLIHTSNLYRIREQEALSDRITALAKLLEDQFALFRRHAGHLGIFRSFVRACARVR